MPALAMLLAFALPSPAHAAGATVVLLHGGGWETGDAASMTPWRDDFAAYGYRTLMVDYPLGNVTASIAYVDKIVQQERLRGGPVIAYGLSAGGTIAAALAAAGRVDGAVDAFGPTDFTTWLSPIGLTIMSAVHMSGAEKRSASPYLRLNGLQTPQLLQCGLADPVTGYGQCARYAAAARRGNPDTTLQPTLNAHGQWPGDRRRAREWVQARWPAR